MRQIGILKYLILIPLIILISTAFYHRNATKQINATLLSEKCISVQHTVDMLAASQVAANEDNIKSAVEYLDKLFQIYAEAYKVSGDEYVLISERYFETSIFVPFHYPEFVNAITKHESGNLVIGYTPEEQIYRDLHIYFRWINQYLVIAGVSQYSIVSDIPVIVSTGQWANIVITFLLNTWLIVLFKRGCSNGH